MTTRGDAGTTGRRGLSRHGRNLVLTTHIAVSVGLLGDSAGYLAVAIGAAGLDDPLARGERAEVLNTLSVVFGIPLSFAALFTGLALGLGTRWGVFRYPWVVAKLALVVSVLVVGGLFIGPASNDLRDGRDTAGTLIVAAAYDVVALTTATALSVFKPGRPFRRTGARR